MHRLIRAVPLVACILVLAGPAFAQSAAPQPDPTPRDILLRHWSDAGEKIVKMAEDFPEDKYEFTPNPAVRSFADNLRHVAFWNGVVAGICGSRSPSTPANTTASSSSTTASTAWCLRPLASSKIER